MLPKLGLLILSLTVINSLISASEIKVLKSAVLDWMVCGMDEAPTNCLEQRTIRKLHDINTDLMKDYSFQISDRSGKVLNESADKEFDPLELENQDLMRKIQERKTEPRGIVDEIGELFTSLTFKFLDPFTDSSNDDENSENEVENEDGKVAVEERGHKKKELKKKNKQLKLILLLMLLKNKIKMFVHKLQFLVQLKFLLVATINMLANVIRLWIEIKKKHKPNKVVYYENAHHQHHYDNEHIHDHDHDHIDDHHHYSHPGSYLHHAHHHEDEEYGGGGIWPWSRSYAEKQSEPTYYRASPYRRYAPGSHSLVYSNQRPLR